MKTFKEYCLTEHPNLRTRIKQAIDPREIMKDKLDDLRALPGKLADKAIDKIQTALDKSNPMSSINKMKTLSDKEKIKKLQKDKKKLSTQVKMKGNEILSIKSKMPGANVKALKKKIRGK